MSFYFVLPPWIGITVLAGVVAAALVKGGADERIVAAGLAVDVVVTVALRDTTWPHVQWAGFGADVLLFILLLVIALRSSKFWPLFAAAFGFLDAITHVGKLVDLHVNQWAYLTAIVIWSYALFIALGIGTWNHWRAQRYLTTAGSRTPAADTADRSA